MNKLLSTVLALFVTSVTASTVLAQDIKGDAKAGAGKIASCIGCHGIKGYQASFPEIYRVPMISGQNAKYISTALAAYQKGERKHPTMRGIAASMTDQDMADVAAHYEADGRKDGVTAPGKAPRAIPRSPRWSRRAPAPPATARASASRSTRVPEDRRPACRLPVRRAEVLQDRRQGHLGPQQCRDGRHCQAVLQRRAQGAGQVHGLAAGRAADRPAGEVPLIALHRQRRAQSCVALPLHAGDVGVAIRRAASPLALPDHPAQALHRAMVRRMQRVVAVRQQFHRLTDAARLVDRALFADRQMHRQVQERIGAAGSLVAMLRSAASRSDSSAWYSGCSSIQPLAIASSGSSGWPWRALA
jgi:cytochrome c553